MSCEALWSIEFVGAVINNVEETFDGGGGVIVFETGRVLGGDSGFTYIGDYEIKNGIMNMKARVKKFKQGVNPLYKDDYTITLTGKYDDNQFDVSGNPDEDQNYKIVIRLTRVAELP